MFSLCVLPSRRCRKLLLRSGASHEASPNPHDPQPVAQLWPLQKDGDLCTSLMHPEPLFFPLCVSQEVTHLLSCSVLTKPAQKRWPSTTATITSSSCAPSDPTTCPSTANRCRDVSAVVWFVSSAAQIQTRRALWASCRCFFAVNVGEDCPVFDGLFEFCQLSGGGSVGKLNLLI